MDPITWPAVIDKALDKLPVDKAYHDLLQPSFQKAGEALATIIDTTNTFLFPVALLNGMRALRLKDSLLKYQAKLDAVNEKVIQVPESISIPIVEKLAVTTNEELSNTFINLLTKASFESTVHLAHPSFLPIIASLSSDEAKLLSAMRVSSVYLYLECSTQYEHQGHVWTRSTSYFTDFEKLVPLDFPQNINFYTENLIKLGILKDDQSKIPVGKEDQYPILEQAFEEKIKKELPTMLDKSKFKPGIIYFTDYGITFMEACMSEINN